MCLSANEDNPLEGKYPLKFDDKGYVTCWKVYEKECKRLISPYIRSNTACYGWIVSNRKKQKAGTEIADINWTQHIDINRGIHVYISRRAIYSMFRAECYRIVPVRCHKSQLVAVGKSLSQAVFMKVFLSKKDYVKAID